MARGYTFTPSDGAEAPSHEHHEDAVENEQDSPGVSRGQNQLHVLPEDWADAAAAIGPLLDRLDAATPGAQLLVVTNDSEAALGIASKLAPGASRAGLRVLAATDSRRAARVWRAAPAQVIAGAPGQLVALVQSTVLKLDTVRAIVLAWVDDLGASPTRALESLMAEVPKEAPRVLLVGAITPAAEQLVERYARRARRVQAAHTESLAPASLSFVAVNDASRLSALGKILDALDPGSASVVTRAPDARAAVESLLRSLGYDDGSKLVSVADAPAASAELIVLFELPASEHELRTLVSEHANARVVALVTPRQVAALRRIAGGAVKPLVLPEAAQRARTREDSLRDELRAMLASGQFSRELLALEPLLVDHDSAEVAAAALRLLETERSKPQAPAAAAVPPMTRLYLNVGSMDNVGPGDLVGAITSEAGISKAEMGRVDVRERHSTVEVATSVADTVVSRITGVSIRNRRVLARVDEGAERSARPRRDDVRLGTRDGGRGRGGPPRDRGGPPRDRGSRDRGSRDRGGRPPRP